MAPVTSKKRKLEDGMRGKVAHSSKRFRKQKIYDSASEASGDEFSPIDPAESDASPPNSPQNTTPKSHDTANPSLDQSSNSESNSDSDDFDSDSSTSSQPFTTTTTTRKTAKRNDPQAFSTSLNAILSSKLTTAKRSDPVLSRNKPAQEAGHELAESQLELKARRALRDQKKKEQDKGRVKDVLLGDRVADAAVIRDGEDDSGEARGVSAAQIAEQERKLRKTAQRGVVKLFNAVRAAQVKGEEAAREARQKGLVGQGRREEKVGEMSKKGFLDLIAGGGLVGSKKAVRVEEG